jgi:hypothetical protein
MARRALLSTVWAVWVVVVAVAATRVAGDVNFDAAAYTVTQQAMEDAPERYAQFVTEMINYLNNMQLSNSNGGGGGCSTSWSIEGTAAQKNFQIEPGTLAVSIVAAGIQTTAVVHGTVTAPVYVRGCHKWWFICFCDTICNGQTTLTLTAPVTTLFTLDWNQGDGLLEVTPTVRACVRACVRVCVCVCVCVCVMVCDGV